MVCVSHATRLVATTNELTATCSASTFVSIQQYQTATCVVGGCCTVGPGQDQSAGSHSCVGCVAGGGGRDLLGARAHAVRGGAPTEGARRAGRGCCEYLQFGCKRRHALNYRSAIAPLLLMRDCMATAACCFKLHFRHVHYVRIALVLPCRLLIYRSAFASRLRQRPHSRPPSARTASPSWTRCSPKRAPTARSCPSSSKTHLWWCRLRLCLLLAPMMRAAGPVQVRQCELNVCTHTSSIQAAQALA